MRERKSSPDSGIFARRFSLASVALSVVAVILAPTEFAISQTITYKIPKRGDSTSLNGRGWSDGTVGGGYVRPDPNYKPALTPDGQPDIQGIWQQTTLGFLTASSIEAIPGGVDIGFGFGIAKVVSRVVDPPDGKIPYLPGARAKVADFFVHYVDPLATCVPTGVPRQMSYINYEIFQTPEEVLIVTEALQNFRHIPLHDHPHVGRTIKLWMGDSRGHWEGNSFVIDVTNLNDETWLSLHGDFHSDQLHVTERLTPIAANTIQYEVTLEDPLLYQRPWKMAFPLFRVPDKKYELLEENCGEGNKSTDSQIEVGRKLYTGLGDMK